jgi:hypothetical protein
MRLRSLMVIQATIITPLSGDGDIMPTRSAPAHR